jgi:hypothetical protein
MTRTFTLVIDSNGATFDVEAESLAEAQNVAESLGARVLVTDPADIDQLAFNLGQAASRVALRTQLIRASAIWPDTELSTSIREAAGSALVALARLVQAAEDAIVFNVAPRTQEVEEDLVEAIKHARTVAEVKYG